MIGNLEVCGTCYGKDSTSCTNCKGLGLQFTDLTDEGLLRVLISRLGLKKAEDVSVGGKEYGITEHEGNKVITIGCGDGYYGFYADFTFDADGKIVKHSVGE